MITRVNKPKISTKHILCECKCKFDGRKCNSNQKWSKDKCLCECKNPREHNVSEKVILGILLHIVAKITNI